MLHMSDKTNRKANLMSINFWRRYLLLEFIYPMGPAARIWWSPQRTFLTILYISFFKPTLFLTYNPAKLTSEIRHSGKDSIPKKDFIFHKNF